MTLTMAQMTTPTMNWMMVMSTQVVLYYLSATTTKATPNSDNGLQASDMTPSDVLKKLFIFFAL